MLHIQVTKLAMFAIFTLLFGLAATACILVTRRQWRIMKSLSETRFDKTFDLIRIIIMIPSIFGFIFGFIFFMIMTIGTLFTGY